MAVFFAGRLIALLIIIVLLIVLLSAALFVVPQQQAYIIERFGKFLKVQFAGIHIRIPFVDRIAMKTNMRGLHSVPREPERCGHRLLRAA